VDLILGMYMLFEERNRFVDFPYPFLKTVASVMMPVNNQENDIGSANRLAAILKPFQLQVIRL
jgi:hypothetical protein